MYVEFQIEDKDMTFELENEKKAYSTKQECRYLVISNEDESECLAVSMTTKQARELADTIYEKLEREGVAV